MQADWELWLALWDDIREEKGLKTLTDIIEEVWRDAAP